MILLDTHVFLWASFDNPMLGRSARTILAEAGDEGTLWISAITPWEIAMLTRKGRLSLQQPAGLWIKAALARSGASIAAIDLEIAVDAGELPADIHGDPADRLIIATARALGCPLLTADRQILGYGKAGHVAVMDARL